MNALRRIHAALIRDGLLVDTQPVAARPQVQAGSRLLGTLDMREWLKTIEAVDELVARTVDGGLYVIEHEQRLLVTDTFESGRELVETVRRNATIDWTIKESVRARLRTIVKRILRRHGYPPDKQDQATLTVLQQAEHIPDMGLQVDCRRQQVGPLPQAGQRRRPERIIDGPLAGPATSKRRPGDYGRGRGWPVADRQSR